MKYANKLAIIVFLAVGGLILFFGILLPVSVSSLFENEIYEVIEEEQNILLYNQNIEKQVKNNNEKISSHVVIMENNNITSTDPFTLSSHVLDTFKKYSNTQEEKIKKYKYKDNNIEVYYIINKNDPNKTIISYMYTMYEKNLVNKIYREIFIITGIAGFLSVFILIIWIYTLITPLNKIKAILSEIGKGNLDVDIPVEVEDEIGEILNSINQMRIELKQLNQTKQEMVQNISHDLKTPIAVIKSYSESIVDGIYPYGNVEDTANVISEQATRLENKVKSLIYLNKLEYLKGQNNKYSYFDMKELIEEVLGYMRLNNENIVITTEMSKTYFYGDREKWQIVLENIIDNFQRYAKTSIEIKLSADTLSLSNDGPNINENLINNLFSPYRMGEGGQFGLGLSIVYKTLQVFNYSIDIRNLKNSGVNFIIKKRSNHN